MNEVDFFRQVLYQDGLIDEFDYRWTIDVADSWELRRHVIVNLAAAGDERATRILNAVIAERMK